MTGQSANTRLGRGEIWNQRVAPDHDARRVLLVHSEPLVGESFAMMLAMRGFDAVQIADGESALRFAQLWHPQVLFVDTRIGMAHAKSKKVDKHDHALARALREYGARGALVQMLVAFAVEERGDPREALLNAGYDGFFRMPCPVWRLFDVVTRFYVH